MSSREDTTGRYAQGTGWVSAVEPEIRETVDILQPLTSSKMARKGKNLAPADVHVLLVEDYDMSRKVLSIFLRRQGFQVHSFGTGTAALEWCTLFSPNVIILDLFLPDISGLDLYDQMRAMPHLSQVPVIFASAFGSEELKQQCLAKGAIAYFQKPASLAGIVACVLQALGLDGNKIITAEDL